jgi:hypothetical protein
VEKEQRMPIKRLLKDSKLNHKQQEMLNAAFIRALRILHLVDRDDPICEMVARKIMEVGAASGASDPIVVSEVVLKQLTIS